MKPRPYHTGSAKSHGMTNSPEYTAWRGARDRCFNPKDARYPNYGGRGISMCDEWRDSFVAFYNHIGPRPPGYMLDRIDNEGDYELWNVRWTTPKISANNRRC